MGYVAFCMCPTAVRRQGTIHGSIAEHSRESGRVSDSQSSYQHEPQSAYPHLEAAGREEVREESVSSPKETV